MGDNTLHSHIMKSKSTGIPTERDINGTKDMEKLHECTGTATRTHAHKNARMYRYSHSSLSRCSSPDLGITSDSDGLFLPSDDLASHMRHIIGASVVL